MHMLPRPGLTSVYYLMQSPMEAVAQAVLGSSGPAPSLESLEVELVEVEPAQQAGQPQQVSTLGAYCCYMHFLCVLQTMHVALHVSMGGEVNPLTLLQLTLPSLLGCLCWSSFSRRSLNPPHWSAGVHLSVAPAEQQPSSPSGAPGALRVELQQRSGHSELRAQAIQRLYPAQRRWFRVGGGRSAAVASDGSVHSRPLP